jgi:hypothetical protein
MTLWFSLDQIELNAMVRRFGTMRATRRRRDGSVNAHAALPERSLFGTPLFCDQASAGVEKKTAVSNS